MADIAYLIKKRPWGCKVIVVGDWNVDLLPAMQSDPFHTHAGRQWRHLEERVMLRTLSDRFGLDIEVPGVTCSTPGGPFAENCLTASITRIPVGDSADTQFPSCLDYALASPGLVSHSEIHWEAAPADHAITVYFIKAGSHRMRSVKSSWKCVDETGCLEWLEQHAPLEFQDLEAFHTCVQRCQDAWADVRTCRERRAARLPQHIRDLYAAAADTRNESERQRFQKTAWQFRKRWCF